MDDRYDARPRASSSAADGGAKRPAPRKEEHDEGKGAGRKHDVQQKPEDQRARPDPKVKE